ncbi:MAG: leucine-rich repeat domain-containing protein [Candidatus Homeothermus sp.]|nr:leucine-rich repeat domain-containing protein [Candidatus Homeothermus sp.]
MKTRLMFLLMLFITIPVSAKNFNYTHEGQTLTYTVIDEREKTCMVKPGETGWWGTTPGNTVSGSLEIPSSVSDGNSTYTVIRLGEYAFYGSSDITSITIPGSVTSIGKRCFSAGIDNENQAILTIEDGMGTLMLEEACFGNVRLSKLYLGRNLDYETGRCPIPRTFITSLTIGNSVNIIGPELFKGARFLPSVKIPDSVVTIDMSAFEGAAVCHPSKSPVPSLL